jgi:hypothetical protein
MSDAPPAGPERQTHPQRWSDDPMDPRRCAVLVPFALHISPPCQCALEELLRRGYEVRRAGGYAAIDQGRSKMATDALADGFEETFWIDADIEFHPDAVDRLRAHRLPVTSAIYPRKGARALASQPLLTGTSRLTMGKGGGLVEILYALSDGIPRLTAAPAAAARSRAGAPAA